MKRFSIITLAALTTLSVATISARTTTQQTSTREVVTVNTTNSASTAKKVSSSSQNTTQQPAQQVVVVVEEPTKVQKSESKVVLTTTRFLTDVDCNVCAQKIVDKLSKDSGVTDVEVDVRTKIVEVTYDVSKNSDTKIIKKLNKIDISAKIIK